MRQNRNYAGITTNDQTIQIRSQIKWICSDDLWIFGIFGIWTNSLRCCDEIMKNIMLRVISIKIYLLIDCQKRKRSEKKSWMEISMSFFFHCVVLQTSKSKGKKHSVWGKHFKHFCVAKKNRTRDTCQEWKIFSDPKNLY